ncbi:MAG TPA: hypothetical protein VK699_12650 [Terriglobales bacterium]|nr:hypothetical protein [Terriglobales bacterium]
MKAKFCSLFACMVLFLPALLPAQGNNIATVVPDGRQESDSIPPNTGNTYLFSPQPGHSYSVEQSRGLNRPTIPMWVASGCPGSPPTDTSTAVPAVTLNIGFAPQRQRISFACAGPVFPFSQQYIASATIQNFSGPAAYTFNLTVTETTLFAGKWKATPNADTFWTFTNTSSAPVNVALALLDSFGNQMNPPAPPVMINPGATFSTDTTQIPLPRNLPPPGGPNGGSVLVSQDGPPNAIQATELIVTNNGAPCPGPTCVTSSESVKLGPKSPIQ